jgi:thiol-disulfide isomerase/thioredoxin
MRRIALFSCGLAAILLSGCGKPDPSGMVGHAAPDTALSPLRPSSDIRLSELKGKIVLLDFWATWCKPCRQLMPYLSKLQGEYGSKGLVVLGISNEPRGMVGMFHEQNPRLGYDLFLDQTKDAAIKYKASGLPTTVLIGKDGNVEYWDQGFSPESVEELRARVIDLVKG